MPSKVHIIHVGNMANKGTQALLKSDVAILREIMGDDVAISVSTTDIEGVKRLSLPLVKVTPPMVDIPYEKADYFAKKFGFQRSSVIYKIFAVGCLLWMSVQSLLSIISVVLKRAGLKSFYRNNVLESFREADVIISYSDENFKDAASFLPSKVYWVLAWWSMLLSRTWDVLCAKFLGKRVIMFPNSVGPFRTCLGRFLARLALNSMKCVLVRDPISYNLLDVLGIRSPKILASDTAILFHGNDNVDLEKFPHPVIGISPGFYAHSLSMSEIEKYIIEYAKALDNAIERHGFYVVFLPHYVSGFQYDDFEVSKSIMHVMRNKHRAEIYEADTVEDFKSVLESMDLVVSSKMHPAVLAVSGYVPTLCVAYDQKQVGFFQHLGLDECVLHVRDFSGEKLLSKIENIWARKKEMKVILKERVPQLQIKVREAVKIALKTCVTVKTSRR